MAEQIAYDEWLCIDQYDISGSATNFGSMRSVALKPIVTFPGPTVVSPAGALYERNLIGVESSKIAYAGFLDMLTNFVGLKAAYESVSGPIVTKGEGRALGSDVLMFVGKEGTFSYGGAVGEVVPASAEISSDGVVVSGSLFEFGPKTTTTTGTSRATSAVTTGKARYLHVIIAAVTGTTPTLDVVYETSAIGDFTDAVTRHTFTQFTPAYLKERAIKTAAVSDLFGRFKWTIGGTGSPSFLVRMVEGVR